MRKDTLDKYLNEASADFEVYQDIEDFMHEKMADFGIAIDSFSGDEERKITMSRSYDRLDKSLEVVLRDLKALIVKMRKFGAM